MSNPNHSRGLWAIETLVEQIILLDAPHGPDTLALAAITDIQEALRREAGTPRFALAQVREIMEIVDRQNVLR